MEHKSRPDPGTPLQLLGYRASIWKRYAGRDAGKLRALPPIITIVLYHGKADWEVPASIFGCIDAGDELSAYVRDFRYDLVSLRPIAYERLSSSPPVRAALGALKFAFDDGVGVEILVAIARDLPDNDPLERQVLYYIVKVYDATEETLKEAVSLAKPNREDELMPTIAQEWIKRGRAEGLAEGEARGKAEGLAESLLEILEARFGPVDAGRRTQVAAMKADDLRPLIKLAATAPTAGAVFANVPLH